MNGKERKTASTQELKSRARILEEEIEANEEENRSMQDEIDAIEEEIRSR